MAFTNSTIVNYPVEEVFGVFIRVAKKDFPEFNESNPIGVSVNKKVGAAGNRSASLDVEITDYKKNELYEITSATSDTVYCSNYQFEKIDENSTRIVMKEQNKRMERTSGVNDFLQGIIFKGRIKKRFLYFIEGLESEVKSHREMLEEERKTNAKAGDKKAKESSLKAEKEAKKIRLEANKTEVIEAKESGEE